MFGAIFVVELPDKTFIAALVLSTRYKPLAVWVGVGLAFFVQTLIAVLAGHLATYLPDVLIKSVALVIFLVGARRAVSAPHPAPTRRRRRPRRSTPPRPPTRAPA